MERESAEFWGLSTLIGHGKTAESISMSIILPKAYLWKPKPDISIYELALCLPVFLLRNDTGIAIEALPAEARRHFEELTKE